MTLDKLPIISKHVLNAHEARLRNKREYEKWESDVKDYLYEKNPVLYSMTEAYAQEPKDEESIRNFAYTIFALINHQIEADEMNRGEE